MPTALLEDLGEEHTIEARNRPQPHQAEVVERGGDPACVLERDAQVPLHDLGVGLADVEQQLHPALHDRHRVVQLPGDGAGELRERLASPPVVLGFVEDLARRHVAHGDVRARGAGDRRGH